MAKQMKLIVFNSPVHQSGQTLLANLMGLRIASKGKLVLLVELDTFFATSNLIHKRVGRAKESLKAVLERVDTISRNIVRSPLDTRFYYIAQPTYASSMDMTSYNVESIDNLITIAKESFDYMIIDAPSSVTDLASTRIFSKSFTHKIDKVVKVLTEDVKSFAMLKDSDTLFTKTTPETYPTDIIINKSHYMYHDYLEKEFITLNKFKVENVFNVCEMPNLYLNYNEGDIYGLGYSKIAKEFLSNIDVAADALYLGEVGIGINVNKAESIKEARVDGAKLFKKRKDDFKTEVKENDLYSKLESDMLGLDKNTLLSSKHHERNGLFGKGKKKQTQGQMQEQNINPTDQSFDSVEEIEVESIYMEESMQQGQPQPQAPAMHAKPNSVKNTNKNKVNKKAQKDKKPLFGFGKKDKQISNIQQNQDTQYDTPQNQNTTQTYYNPHPQGMMSGGQGVQNSNDMDYGIEEIELS